MNKKALLVCILYSVFCILASCRHDDPVLPPEEEPIGQKDTTEIVGFYVLNEGNMGSNKASLDYYDYQSGIYSRNIYAERNPDVPKELGDVGNDLQAYGQRLYAVINCSNKVEVMDLATAKRIGQIDIPNCRYIAFHGPYGYVTSYAGPVSLDASHAQIGYVARFDTATLQIDATCTVGYQPDELCVLGDKLYVANSGGYMVPDYDHTLSVIDLNTFTGIHKIDVAPNLHRVRADQYGYLWATSRGDYYEIPPQLFCIDTKTDLVIGTWDIAVSDLDIIGDTLYACATAWDYIEMDDVLSYTLFDIKQRRLLTSRFITDGTDALIDKPYGIKVNPRTRDIYITDAKDYVTPGELHCFSPQGVHQWSGRAGDIPAHIAFVHKQLEK